MGESGPAAALQAARTFSKRDDQGRFMSDDWADRSGERRPSYSSSGNRERERTKGRFMSDDEPRATLSRFRRAAADTMMTGVFTCPVATAVKSWRARSEIPRRHSQAAQRGAGDRWFVGASADDGE